MTSLSALDSRARRDEFARLIADDLRRGGLDEAHRNIVHHARSVRLDPWRALRLQFDQQFVADVHRLSQG